MIQSAWAVIMFFILSLFSPACIYSATTTTKKTSTTKTTATADQKQNTENKDEDADKEEDDEEDDDDGVSMEFGGDEETRETDDITVSGAGIKEVTISGIKLIGQFTQQSPGVYLAQGEIKPDWDFDIKLGAAGQLIVNKNQNKITGQLYIQAPVLGKIGEVTDLVLSTTQIKFKGVLTEKIKLGSLGIKVGEAIVDFELSKNRIAAKAGAGAVFAVTGIPGVDEVKIDILSVDAGFVTAIPPEGISVSGSGTVTAEIPPLPPIKVDLSGKLKLTKNGISGEGAVELFGIEVGNGDFEISTKGIFTLNIKAGVFEEGIVECSIAGAGLSMNLPKRLLTAELSQEVKLLDAITIPGTNKATLTIDGKTKKLTVTAKAGISLTGGMPIGPEALSLGIKDFLFDVTPYNTTNPIVKLNGAAYISLWTLGGFSGTIQNAVLNGKGNLNLPPGLNTLLGVKTVSLPVSVDLRSGQTLAELGGSVAGLAIKHFPLEGPELIIKNDGIHLKGKIGIANVITIPLGDLLFTQNESATSVKGNVGIGPFTLAEGNFVFPSGEAAGITFSGKMGIPGLSGQKLNGTIYKDGKLEFSGLTKIGLVNVDTMGKFSVSKDKLSLHADTAGFGVGLGGLAKCSLVFTGLDISPAKISGTATGTFSGVLGIEAALKGNFSFDGSTVELTYPSAVTLCGISVGDARLSVGVGGVSGSGKISSGGESITVSITIENGVLKLKGPLGELIAEGMRIVGNLADTASEIASEEKEVIAEDAEGVMNNLSRMSDPWIKEMVAAASAAKSFYNGVEKIVSDEVFSRVGSALNTLKNVVDAAVLYAKGAIAGGVDAMCGGIIALIDGVNEIFSDIESLIPADYLSTYNTVKNKVISKANILRDKVVLFRDNTKASLYNLTGTITAIYQGAIDTVTSEANKVASGIKKQMDPAIKEIDQLLTEVGQEINAASSAVGDEATQHYNIAKEKAGFVKNKANSIISNYKNKIADLVSPYIQSITNKITPYTDKVAKVRDEVIAKGIAGLKEAKKDLDPYIQPFEDAVGELKDLAETIGGAVFQKFLEGVGAAGDALNSALGAAGAGLVKATDLVGDAAVAVTGLAADASGAVYDAASSAASAVASGASAAVNFAQETGSQAVSVAVNTAQQGYQVAVNAGSQVTQAASNAYESASSAASSAASQAYASASSAYNNVEQQVSSTVNNVISNLPSISPSSFATGSPVSFSQIQSGAQAVSAKINDIVNSVSSAASSAYNAASSAASSAASAVSSGASTVAGGISSGWSSAKSFVSGIFGSGGTPPPPPPPDYSAPTVSNVSAASTTNSITVTWNTSSAARTLLFYSATPNVNYSGQDAVTRVTSVRSGDYYPETTNHSITVDNLNPGTAYYYLVYSYRMVNGEASNVAKQGIYSIVTQPITAIIGGVVKDKQNNAIPSANIFVDNSAQAATVADASGKYAIEVTPGAHTITAKKSDFLSSSSTTSNLSAGQILPLDFNLADGRIYISGSVKEAPSGGGISSATVKLLNQNTVIAQATTDAGGAFSFTVPMASENPLSFTINASKANYVTYASGAMNLARGAKMQNFEIRLPHVPPALSGDVSVSEITANHAKISFNTEGSCSAFVQFGQQAGANYQYQTPAQSGKTTFSFDLSGLTAATTYKYKVVLQDTYGNTIIAKENAVFTTVNPNNFGNISLNVLSGITGQAVSGLQVVLVSPANQTYTTATNSIGNAKINNLPVGTQTVTINNSSVTGLKATKTAQLSVAGNSTTTATLYLDAGNQASIGLSPTVNNITSNSAKLNINSICKILKHKLILRDATTNSKIIDQDLGVLVSPATIDLNNLIDGHSYAVELTGSLLNDTTTGNVVKTETKNFSFSTVALPDFKIQNLSSNPSQVQKGRDATINIACTLKINHAITNAVLKVFAQESEIFSQSFPSYNPGLLQLNIPISVNSIPGTGKIPLKVLFRTAASQVQDTENVLVNPGTGTGEKDEKEEGKSGAKQPAEKFSIQRITLESEENETVSTGNPLMVLVEIEASENISGPLEVNLELKRKEGSQTFKEGIEKLRKGTNKFKWDLIKRPEPGAYALSVTIASPELKIKDKMLKKFSVVGKEE